MQQSEIITVSETTDLEKNGKTQKKKTELNPIRHEIIYGISLSESPSKQSNKLKSKLSEMLQND